MKRITSVLAAAVAIILGTSAAAQAACTDNLAFNQNGGTVVVSVYSNTTLKISSTTYKRNLAVGDTSKHWFEFQDTDAFYLGPYQAARNVQTGYIYDGGPNGKWFCLENDRVYIALDAYYY
jgi:opacity protein-like surface antigen